MPRKLLTEEEKKERRRNYMREYQKKRYHLDNTYRFNKIQQVKKNTRKKRLLD